MLGTGNFPDFFVKNLVPKKRDLECRPLKSGLFVQFLDSGTSHLTIQMLTVLSYHFSTKVPGTTTTTSTADISGGANGAEELDDLKHHDVDATPASPLNGNKTKITKVSFML